MILDGFNLPRKVLVLIESVHESEVLMLYRAVMRYVYEDNSYYASRLEYGSTRRVFEQIVALLEKPIARARKAQQRKNERMEHPEKFPPRKRRAPRAGVYELPSGQVVEIDRKREELPFDYYCRCADGSVMYFRKVGDGYVDGEKVSYRPLEAKVPSLMDVIKKPARRLAVRAEYRRIG